MAAVFPRAIVIFIVSTFVVSLWTVIAGAAPAVLFPAPLHITRELTSPVTNAKSVVDEYCHGNRVVSVSGRRTAIADYEKGEITLIDFAAGTYSVTKFEAIAKISGRTDTAAQSSSRADGVWRVDRHGDVLEATRGERTIRVRPDPQHTVSRAALEALAGTAYPNRRDEGEDAVLGALRVERSGVAANSAQSEAEYHLPLEHIVRVEVGADVVETRNVVVRVGNELPPPDLLAIPPGAKLVESPIVAAQRAMDELDHPPVSQH